ncbi:MAG: DinB family protein [Planctomycetes bacterium]|nr:DinB family protein [Planctomycetota bacterium]
MPPQRSETLATLRRSGDDLVPFFAMEAAASGRAYAAGKWTAHQVLIHLADAETVFFDRLRRLAADEHPLLWAYDENRWADRLAYGQRSLVRAGALFAATRAAVIELIEVLPPDAWDRGGVHSEAGARSFAQVAGIIASHTTHHLAQVRAAADGRTWTADAGG